MFAAGQNRTAIRVYTPVVRENEIHHPLQIGAPSTPTAFPMTFTMSPGQMVRVRIAAQPHTTPMASQL